MKKTRFFLGLGVFLAANSFALLYAQDEHLTITTYYPSPYGVYRELTTTGKTYLAQEEGTHSPTANAYDSFVNIGSFDENADGNQELNGTGSFTCCPVGCVPSGGWFASCRQYAMPGTTKVLVQADPGNDNMALYAIDYDQDSPGGNSAFSVATAASVFPVNFTLKFLWWEWVVNAGKAYFGLTANAIGDQTNPNTVGVGLSASASGSKLNRAVWGIVTGDSDSSTGANSAILGESYEGDNNIAVVGTAVRGDSVQGVFGGTTDEDIYGGTGSDFNTDTKIGVQGAIGYGSTSRDKNENDIGVKGYAIGVRQVGVLGEARRCALPLVYCNNNTNNLGVRGIANGNGAIGIQGLAEEEGIFNDADNRVGIQGLVSGMNDIAIQGLAGGTYPGINNKACTNCRAVQGAVIGNSAAGDARIGVEGLAAGNNNIAGSFVVSNLNNSLNNVALRVALLNAASETMADNKTALEVLSGGRNNYGITVSGTGENFIGMSMVVAPSGAGSGGGILVNNTSGDSSYAIKGIAVATSSAIYGQAPDAPDTYAGNFNGRVRMTAGCYINCNHVSSRELKEDIRYFNQDDYSSTLSRLNEVKVVNYKWREGYSNDKNTQIGIIAEESIPELTSGDGKLMNITGSLGFLLAVTKAQQQEIEELKSEIRKLQQK